MFLWLIEHIIGNIPVWVWTFVAGGGIAAFFIGGIASRWPTIKPYSVLVRYAGLAVFTAGIFMCGGAGVTAVMQKAIKEMQDKVAVAEQKSKQANEDLAKSLKDKKNKTKEVQIVIQERIREVEKKIDSECKVAPEAISILNDAAKNVGGKK